MFVLFWMFCLGKYFEKMLIYLEIFCGREDYFEGTYIGKCVIILEIAEKIFFYFLF